MRDAECRMRNLGFPRRGDRSPAGCAEVKLNGGCANKLRQALPFGEGAAFGGGRGANKSLFRCTLSVHFFVTGQRNEPKKARLGALPLSTPLSRPLPVRIAMAAPWAIRRRGREPKVG